MPTLVRTNQTKADLLQRKLEINSELRELRNRYDKPGVVEVPGDRQRVDDLIARHTPGDARCFRDQMRSRTPMRHQRFPSCGPSIVDAVRQVAANRFTRATHLDPVAAGVGLAPCGAGHGWAAVVRCSGSETGMNAMGTLRAAAPVTTSTAACWDAMW